MSIDILDIQDMFDYFDHLVHLDAFDPLEFFDMFDILDKRNQRGQLPRRDGDKRDLANKLSAKLLVQTHRKNKSRPLRSRPKGAKHL
ncbi:hypothetical protein [Rubellicoccus peritrichatus]|uniref:Uncharacterized protein n=1 Tax=Rubellicoccus peritrichatus TaxID=3080537 RepID=A0AAQ3QTC3_9BACT|nr:hypothetical protein [Puniceicoccus sp. CR14]WOO41176.1 hypothetical protein RZN69_21355 [Puniceicoccus sp. CR14]